METPNKPTARYNAPPPHGCSYQTCKNGHYWTPQLALPGCNGCHGPLIAIRMVNCPICNEPATHTRLRIDHLGGAHPITAVCKRELHVGPEYIFAEIDHQHNAWTASGDQPEAPAQQTIEPVPAQLASETEG